MKTNKKLNTQTDAEKDFSVDDRVKFKLFQSSSQQRVKMRELQAECLSKVLPYMGMKREEMNQDKEGVFRTRGRRRQRSE